MQRTVRFSQRLLTSKARPKNPNQYRSALSALLVSVSRSSAGPKTAMVPASAEAPRSKSPPSEARSAAPTRGRVWERREHRASPALHEAVREPRAEPMLREACGPPPRAPEGEPASSAQGRIEPPRAPEGRRQLRTESRERPPLATKRRSIHRSPRSAARGAPSLPKLLLAAALRSPPK